METSMSSVQIEQKIFLTQRPHFARWTFTQDLSPLSGKVALVVNQDTSIPTSHHVREFQDLQ
jgi:hypothetical protein